MKETITPFARDEEVRALISSALDQTMLVEAGAGTGKTRALVDRMLSHVRAGTQIERIIAITFTEKAAAELRDRVRGELERSASDPAQPQADVELMRRALDCLDRAQISTIHAFGQALMHQFAAEAGIDPAFRVEDEVQSERHFEDAWREELRSLAASPAAAAAIERVLILGMNTRDLRRLVGAFADVPGVSARLVERPLKADPFAWPDFAEFGQRLLDMNLATVAANDKLRLKAESFGSLLDRLMRAGDEVEHVLGSAAASLTREPKYSTTGNRPNWGNDAARLDAARADLTEIHSALRQLLVDCRSEALAAALPYLAAFVERYGIGRAREGLLSFDDLIYGPSLLLRRSETARDTLRDRYDVMLIDEFQDTDPLQVEIARAFATDPNTGTLEAGRLFLVGDPKQSIYRFRRADIAVYARTREDVRHAGGLLPQLQLNRRSRGIIIDWVNGVFGGLIDSTADPSIQPPYVDVAASRDDDLQGVGVGVVGGLSELKAPALKRFEAAQVAARCAEIIVEGWQVRDRDTGVARAAELSDIAILIPTRSGLGALERALQAAGVPYRVEGGSLIYQTQEVRDLLNCLTAIDDPSDEIAIVAALRSPAFACSDRDLAQWRASGGRFSYRYRGNESLDGRVAGGLRALAEWHDRRYAESLASLVERFVAAYGFDQTGMFVTGTRDSFRRMRFVVEQARQFESEGPESLRAFVAWMERRAGGRVLDHEGAGLDDDERAVRILTVHGSKGLEFPIVILAGLSTMENARTPALMVDRQSDAIALRIGAATASATFTLGDAEELARREREHATAERTRLLYVAATRARDHLVLSLYYNEKQQTSAAKLLIGAGARDGATELPELPELPMMDRRPFAEFEIEQAQGTPEELAAARRALVEGSRRERYTSATALKGLGAQEQKPERSDETEPWAHGRGGTRLGRAVHAAIQSLPLDASATQIESHARAQAVAEAIPTRAGDVAELVARALASDAATRARSARRALREVPFGVPIDGSVIEGFIDMLVESGEGLEIVDWKTDRVAAGAVDERLREYELQAGLYVLGIEAATGLKVNRITYVFVSAGVEASPGIPEQLAASARARVASIS